MIVYPGRCTITEWEGQVGVSNVAAMADGKKLVGMVLRRAAEDAVRTSLRTTADRTGRRAGGSRSTRADRPTRSGRTDGSASRPPQPGGYPGDFTGRPTLTYTPREDGRPDPGEVVWTWVPYEDDHSQGKDRPVLLVGSEGPWLLGLQLTSRDHDLDEAQEASQGRYWMDIGTGAWDREGRASEVRLNRLIRIDPAQVRRTAARLDERRFAEVARGVLEHCRAQRADSLGACPGSGGTPAP